jgi:hypothetical protein
MVIAEAVRNYDMDGLAMSLLCEYIFLLLYFDWCPKHSTLDKQNKEITTGVRKPGRHFYSKKANTFWLVYTLPYCGLFMD